MALKMAAGANEPSVLAAWEIERTSVFQYERIPLVLRVAHPEGITLARLRISGLPAAGQLALTPFEQQGLPRVESIAGRDLLVTRYRAQGVADAPGRIRLEAELHFSQVEQRTQSYFFTQRFERPGSVRPPSIILDVRELPVANRPDDFDGAVGRFRMHTAIEAPMPVTPGTLVTLSTSVSGTGHFDRIRPPTPSAVAVDDLRWYEAREIPGTVGSTRIFERIVVPINTGETTIPALHLPFFDPWLETYQVLTNGPFRVAVAEPSTPDFEPPVLPSWNGYGRNAHQTMVLQDRLYDEKKFPIWGWLLPPMLALGLAVMRRLRTRRNQRLP